jgi:hypothetical protein
MIGLLLQQHIYRQIPAEVDIAAAQHHSHPTRTTVQVTKSSRFRPVGPPPRGLASTIPTTGTTPGETLTDTEAGSGQPWAYLRVMPDPLAGRFTGVDRDDLVPDTWANPHDHRVQAMSFPRPILLDAVYFFASFGIGATSFGVGYFARSSWYFFASSGLPVAAYSSISRSRASGMRVAACAGMLFSRAFMPS